MSQHIYCLISSIIEELEYSICCGLIAVDDSQEKKHTHLEEELSLHLSVVVPLLGIYIDNNALCEMRQHSGLYLAVLS
ncbi:MAG: hypothetical protein WAW59_03880 [Patescibacteria group bacterium]